MLSDLDIDVLLQVFAWLHPHDILSLRQTSRHYSSLTRLRVVWSDALTNLLADNVPIARVLLDTGAHKHTSAPRDLSSLSVPELERMVLAARRTKDIWERMRPERTHATRMRTRIGRVLMLRFLRIWSSVDAVRDDVQNEGRYLLSFGHTAAPTLCMQIWDVEASSEGQNGERLVAEWAANGRVIGIAADEGNGLHDWASDQERDEPWFMTGALIAVSVRCFTLFGQVSFVFWILHFMPLIPSGGTISILKPFQLHGPLNVRAMHGRLVAVQVRANSEGQSFGHGILKVVDWVRSSEISTQDMPRSSVAGISNSGREIAAKLEPSIHGTNRAVLYVHFFHDWVAVFRESVLEMYFVPPSSLGRPRMIRPSVVHKWLWQINSLAVTERVSWSHERRSAYCSACHEQGFIPYSFTGGNENGRIACSCRYRPFSIAARFDSYYPWPVNLLHHFVVHVNPSQTTSSFLEAECPYVLPPVLVDIVPSTVRLFGRSALVLGRYGTLIWTDSEANMNGRQEGEGQEEAYFAEGTGERVAGRRMRLPSWSDLESVERLGTRQQQQQQQESSASRAEPPTTTTQPDGTMSGGCAAQTSVFATRLTEGWYSLALCESKGRIAVGDADGVVEVWDHF